MALFLVTASFRRRGWYWIPLLAGGILVVSTQWSLSRLQTAWSGPDGERERRIERASARLNAELTAARLLADSLAGRALEIGSLSQERGFGAAARLIRSGPLESGLVVFEPNGAPRAWAGRFRLPPDAAGDSVDVRLTPYYAVMQVRRHDSAGRTGLGAVLLTSDGSVPDGDRSLAERFRQRTEVGLRLLDPASAPDISDVFDYTLPTTAGPEVLFSVQFVPPGQSEAIARAWQSGASRVTWVLLLTLIGAFGLVPGGTGRFLLALLTLELVIRAPIGPILGISAWLDPAGFSSPLLGPATSSAGTLALVGAVLILTARLLRQRALPRLVSAPLGILGLVATPLLLSSLGRGISPPAAGVSVGQWLIWHTGLFLAGAGLITVSLGGIRSGRLSGQRWEHFAAASGLGIAAAVIGISIWQPLRGWPEWYLGLWLLASLPLLWPGDWRAELVAVAVLAGSASAVVTWGAASDGKVRAAEADLAGLAETTAPVFDRYLHEWGRSLGGAGAPRQVADLYRAWWGSPENIRARPALLAAWDSGGGQILELRLGELDLPRELIAGEVRQMPPGDSVLVKPIAREPGVHHLVLVRTGAATILSAALGPATGLVQPSRLGRLLVAGSVGRPLYRLAVSPTPAPSLPSEGSAGTDSTRWRREGRFVLGQRTVAVARIPRSVHATVEVGRPGSLLVPGTLAILLDLVVLAGLWVAAGGLAGRPIRRPAWVPRIRSYEARIGLTLAGFFLAPTIGFAAWGIGRLRGEVRAARDRNIEQALRDVLPAGAELPRADPELSAELQSLGNRMDADFLLYREGRLIAGPSRGLLEALGVVSPLMDPDAFHRVVIDGAAVATSPSPSGSMDVRIGYRSLRLADFSAGILAMPQAGFDPVLEDRQRDLAMLFGLLTIVGIAASLLGARVAARALSRPVAELQQAALAFGQGREVEPPGRTPAPEFEPVFSAFQKMAADVRKSREAKERVARIVAWGEMATQVAHEIKNPLTPMRLGVQHLRRVYEDGRTPIGPVLEGTTGRILAEIDRLDRIARSFSRFGVPASERGPLEDVKLPSVVRDVAELYRLGPEGAEVVVEVDQAVPAAARADEIKEALVNLLENSRHAGARTIRVRIAGTDVSVQDDGRGIPAALLPKIFEPRFSTSTSGSGLGLPIVKRLVEGWGGKVEVESEEGRGTLVRLHLRPAGSAGPGPAPSGSQPPSESVQ